MVRIPGSGLINSIILPDFWLELGETAALRRRRRRREVLRTQSVGSSYHGEDDGEAEEEGEEEEEDESEGASVSRENSLRRSVREEKRASRERRRSKRRPRSVNSNAGDNVENLWEWVSQELGIAPEPWQTSRLELNSGNAQILVLLVIYLTELAVRIIFINSTMTLALTAQILFIQGIAELTLYSHVVSLQLPIFTDSLYGKMQYWSVRHLVVSVAYSICVAVSSPVLAGVIMMLFILIWLSTVLLILPWPIEGIEINAEKAGYLKHYRTDTVRYDKYLFTHVIYSALLFGNPMGIFSNPVLVSFAGCLLYPSATTLLGKFEVMPHLLVAEASPPPRYTPLTYST